MLTVETTTATETTSRAKSTSVFAKSAFSTVAVDGTYLYVHTAQGLAKIGTGFEGSVAGKIYASRKDYFPTTRLWIACVRDRLYIRTPGVSPVSLLVISTEDLSDVGSIMQNGNGTVRTSAQPSMILLPDKTPRSTTAPHPQRGEDGRVNGDLEGVDPLHFDHVGGLFHYSLDDSSSDGEGYSGRNRLPQRTSSEPAERRSSEGSVLDPVLSLDVEGEAPPERRRSTFGSVMEEQFRNFLGSRLGNTRESAPRSAATTHSTRISPSGPPPKSDPDCPRSPLITDGKYLYIISLGKRESRPDDDISDSDSEAGGERYNVASYFLDSFDPADGMRLVDSLALRGPLTHLDQDDSMTRCANCSKLLYDTGLRCINCPATAPFDICNDCHPHAVGCNGHDPSHAMHVVNSMISANSDSENDSTPQPFPQSCLENGSFYVDGSYLMVVLPPYYLGSSRSLATQICRAFSLETGSYCFDLAIPDAPNYAGLAFDSVNNLTWAVNPSATNAHRWRHPWTRPCSAADSDSATEKSSKHSVARVLLKSLAIVSDMRTRMTPQKPLKNCTNVWSPLSLNSDSLAQLFRLIRKFQGAADSAPAESQEKLEAIENIVHCLRVVSVIPFHTEQIVETARDILLKMSKREDADFLEVADEAARCVALSFNSLFATPGEQVDYVCNAATSSASRDIGAISTLLEQMEQSGISNFKIMQLFAGKFAADLTLLPIAKNLISVLTKPLSDPTKAPAVWNQTIRIMRLVQRHLLGRMQTNEPALDDFSCDLLKHHVTAVFDAFLKCVAVENAVDSAQTLMFVQDIVLPLTVSLLSLEWRINALQDISQSILEQIRISIAGIQLLETRCPSAKRMAEEAETALKNSPLQYSRAVGSKTVHIPRKQRSTKVTIPGANFVLVELDWDPSLGKKESLRISANKESGAASALIKHRARKATRARQCIQLPGDSAVISFQRSSTSSYGSLSSIASLLTGEEIGDVGTIPVSVWGFFNEPFSFLLDLKWLPELNLSLNGLAACLCNSLFLSVVSNEENLYEPWLNSFLLRSGLEIGCEGNVPLERLKKDSEPTLAFPDDRSKRSRQSAQASSSTSSSTAHFLPTGEDIGQDGSLDVFAEIIDVNINPSDSDSLKVSTQLPIFGVIAQLVLLHSKSQRPVVDLENEEKLVRAVAAAILKHTVPLHELLRSCSALDSRQHAATLPAFLREAIHRAISIRNTLAFKRVKHKQSLVAPHEPVFGEGKEDVEMLDADEATARDELREIEDVVREESVRLQREVIERARFLLLTAAECSAATSTAESTFVFSPQRGGTAYPSDISEGAVPPKRCGQTPSSGAAFKMADDGSKERSESRTDLLVQFLLNSDASSSDLYAVMCSRRRRARQRIAAFRHLRELISSSTSTLAKQLLCSNLLSFDIDFQLMGLKWDLHPLSMTEGCELALLSEINSEFSLVLKLVGDNLRAALVPAPLSQPISDPTLQKMFVVVASQLPLRFGDLGSLQSSGVLELLFQLSALNLTAAASKMYPSRRGVSHFARISLEDDISHHAWYSALTLIGRLVQLWEKNRPFTSSPAILSLLQSGLVHILNRIEKLMPPASSLLKFSLLETDAAGTGGVDTENDVKMGSADPACPDSAIISSIPLLLDALRNLWTLVSLPDVSSGFGSALPASMLSCLFSLSSHPSLAIARLALRCLGQILGCSTPASVHGVCLQGFPSGSSGVLQFFLRGSGAVLAASSLEPAAVVEELTPLVPATAASGPMPVPGEIAFKCVAQLSRSSKGRVGTMTSLISQALAAVPCEVSNRPHGKLTSGEIFRTLSTTAYSLVYLGDLDSCVAVSDILRSDGNFNTLVLKKDEDPASVKENKDKAVPDSATQSTSSTSAALAKDSESLWLSGWSRYSLAVEMLSVARHLAQNLDWKLVLLSLVSNSVSALEIALKNTPVADQMPGNVEATAPPAFSLKKLCSANLRGGKLCRLLQLEPACSTVIWEGLGALSLLAGSDEALRCGKQVRLNTQDSTRGLPSGTVATISEIDTILGISLVLPALSRPPLFPAKLDTVAVALSDLTVVPPAPLLQFLSADDRDTVHVTLATCRSIFSLLSHISSSADPLDSKVQAIALGSAASILGFLPSFATAQLLCDSTSSSDTRFAVQNFVSGLVALAIEEDSPSLSELQRVVFPAFACDLFALQAGLSIKLLDCNFPEGKPSSIFSFLGRIPPVPDIPVPTEQQMAPRAKARERGSEAARSRARSEQRRAREGSARTLADITGQSVALCLFALEREEDNQDRAANWLFEHGQQYAIEHPEYMQAAAPSTDPSASIVDVTSTDDSTAASLLFLPDSYSSFDPSRLAPPIAAAQPTSRGRAGPLGDPSSDFQARVLDQIRSQFPPGILPEESAERYLGALMRVSALAQLQSSSDSVATRKKISTLRPGTLLMLAAEAAPSGSGDESSKTSAPNLPQKYCVFEGMEGVLVKVLFFDAETGIVSQKILQESLFEIAPEPRANAMDDFLEGMKRTALSRAICECNRLASRLAAQQCLSRVLSGLHLSGAKEPLSFVAECVSHSGGAAGTVLHKVVLAAHQCLIPHYGRAAPLSVDNWASTSELLPAVKLCLSRILTDAGGASSIGKRTLQLSPEDAESSPSSKKKMRDDVSAVEDGGSKKRATLSPVGNAQPETTKRKRCVEDGASAAVNCPPDIDSVPTLGGLLDCCMKFLEVGTEAFAGSPTSKEISVPTSGSMKPTPLEISPAAPAVSQFVAFNVRTSLPAGSSLQFFSSKESKTPLLVEALPIDGKCHIPPFVLPVPVFVVIEAPPSAESEESQAKTFPVISFQGSSATMEAALSLAELLAEYSPKDTQLILLDRVADLLSDKYSLPPPLSLRCLHLVSDIIRNCSLALASHSRTWQWQHSALALVASNAARRFTWERGAFSHLTCGMLEALSAIVIPTCVPGEERVCNLPAPFEPSELLRSLLVVDRVTNVLCLDPPNPSLLRPLLELALYELDLESQPLSFWDRLVLNETMVVGDDGNLLGTVRIALSQLLRQDTDKITAAQAASLLSANGWDGDLIRWTVTLDTALTDWISGYPDGSEVAFCYLQQNDEVVGGVISNSKLPQSLSSFPRSALFRRSLLLRLFNKHISNVLPLLDFSRVSVQSSLAQRVARHKRIIFSETKALFFAKILKITSSNANGRGDEGMINVVLNRPGRRGRSLKEGSDEGDRWAVTVTNRSAETGHFSMEDIAACPAEFGDFREHTVPRGKLEGPMRFTKAKNEFGGSELWGASSRLALADPPIANRTLDNCCVVKGNTVLIERGGGHFVSVVRNAQNAGATAVVIADSCEGSPFQMGAESSLMNVEIRIPSVMISRSDGLMLRLRGLQGEYCVGGEGILSQTWKQLRTVSSARMRRGDEVPWRVTFQGEGHEGFQGPYREAVSVICQEMQGSSFSSLFIPCPNAAQARDGSGGVGENRDRYIINPSARRNTDLLGQLFFTGQVMGMAIRSRNLLNLDLAPIVWKQILDLELSEQDFRAVDYSTWRSLQHTDPSGEILERDVWESVFQSNWTATLSDGTVVELKEGGAKEQVGFDDRWRFSDAVIQRRLCESAEGARELRQGLISVIPHHLLTLLTWEELETKICGSPDLDINLLRKHTRYRGSVSETNPHIINFWKVLENFSQTERRLFLRFAWGRERLPQEADFSESSEMKIFPSDRGNGDSVLPESETCFFIIKLPMYRTLELMRTNLLNAITSCTEINF